MLIGFLLRFAAGRAFQGVLRKVPGVLWVALGVILFFSLAGYLIYARGYSSGFAEADSQWQAQVAEERLRQVLENQAAVDAAFANIRQLHELERERNELISHLQQEASEDPNASRPALSIDSVRRLNQIQ